MWGQFGNNQPAMLGCFWALIWLLSRMVKARWRGLTPTVRRSMCLASDVMTARGSGVRLGQSERRLAQPCALIGREPCVTRGDRCGRVLAAIPVARQTLDSVHCPPSITSNAWKSTIQYWIGVLCARRITSSELNCLQWIGELSAVQIAMIVFHGILSAITLVQMFPPVNHHGQYRAGLLYFKQFCEIWGHWWWTTGLIVDDRKEASAPHWVLMPLVMRLVQLALHQTSISAPLSICQALYKVIETLQQYSHQITQHLSGVWAAFSPICHAP